MCTAAWYKCVVLVQHKTAVTLGKLHDAEVMIDVFSRNRPIQYNAISKESSITELWTKSTVCCDILKAVLGRGCCDKKGRKVQGR